VTASLELHRLEGKDAAIHCIGPDDSCEKKDGTEGALASEKE